MPYETKISNTTWQWAKWLPLFARKVKLSRRIIINHWRVQRTLLRDKGTQLIILVKLLVVKFYLRDAMLHSGTVGLCVCVCVCHQSVFYRNDWTDHAGFWHGSICRSCYDIAPSALETIIFYCFMSYISALAYYYLLLNIRKAGISKFTGTSLWKFVQISGLKKIVPRFVDRRNVLSY